MSLVTAEWQLLTLCIDLWVTDPAVEWHAPVVTLYDSVKASTVAFTVHTRTAFAAAYLQNLFSQEPGRSIWRKIWIAACIVVNTSEWSPNVILFSRFNGKTGSWPPAWCHRSQLLAWPKLDVVRAKVDPPILLWDGLPYSHSFPPSTLHERRK